MKKLLLVAGLIVLFSGIAGAQSKRHVMGQNDAFASPAAISGDVVIYTNPHLDYLLERYIAAKQEENGVPGWRIQIFFGSGQGAGDRARKTKKQFEEAYDLKAYLIYQSPYFKIRVGNFRLNDKSAAIRAKENIETDYPNCWIVEDTINPDDREGQ